MHPGLDLGDNGTPVPVCAGTYGYVSAVNQNPGNYLPGYVDLKVYNGERYVNVRYGHLDNIPSDLKVGQKVTPNTVIGNTQKAQQHLHLELWGTATRNGPDVTTMVNPLPYFPVELQVNLTEIAKNQKNQDRVTYVDGWNWQTPYGQPVIKRIPG